MGRKEAPAFIGCYAPILSRPRRSTQSPFRIEMSTWLKCQLAAKSAPYRSAVQASCWCSCLAAATLSNSMPGQSLHVGQLVTHLCAFGFQVTLIMLVHRRNNRHLIDNLKVKATKIERLGLFGIVGQQPDFAES